MGFIQEFKAFIMRGNVLDLAIGIVIGAAFNKIVSSFVNDILMPPIGILLQGVNFKDLKYVLKPAEGEVAAVAINYGMFFQSIIDFLIIGFSVFVIIKVYAATKKKEEPAPATPAPLTKSEELLTEIRDSLKQKNA